MHRLVREVLAYGVASGIALAVDTGLLYTLTRVGWNYLPASAVGFIAGALVIYVLSIQLVFRFHRIRSRGLEFGYFVGLGLAGLTVNSGAMLVAVGGLGVNILVAKAFAAGCTFTTNFALRRQLLFRPEPAVP